MPERTIAIGDIHGCDVAFEKLLQEINPTENDCIVCLGDFIDRGPKSRDVIDRLIALQKQCQLVALQGNHEEMMMNAGRMGGREFEYWLQFGGKNTLDSYFGGIHDVPFDHIEFLMNTEISYQDDTHMFFHASYQPKVPFEKQDEKVIRWDSIFNNYPDPHVSGKTVIVGHTAQQSGEILDIGHLVCIDTYCHGGGWLTGYETKTGQVWQTNDEGEVREIHD